MGRKGKLGKNRKDQSKTKHSITLESELLFVLYQVMDQSRSGEEQDLRDRNFVIRAIDESEYDPAKGWKAEDWVSDKQSELEDKKGGIKAQVKQLSSEFVDKISSICEPQTLILKRRQLDYVRKELIETGRQWLGEHAFLVEALLDAIDEAPEWEEPIDKNDEGEEE